MMRSSGPAPFGAGPEALLDVACRVAEIGTPPPPEVTAAARESAASLAKLSPANVRRAIEVVLLSPHLGEGLQWLHESGLLAVMLPEIDATVNFSQEAGRRHKDVWEHTKQVVRQAPDKPLVRWSALLHDIGKVPTRVLLPDGRVTFHRHAEVGARMFDSISRRLNFERPDRQKIRFLILNHLRMNAYQGSWTDAAVRRFDHEMGPHLEDLIDLSRADVTSRRPGRKEEAARNIESLMQRIVAIRELDARVPPLPPGLGNAIMESFQLPPSKRIGELRKLCEDAVEQGELQERQPAEYYVQFLRARGVVG